MEKTSSQKVITCRKDMQCTCPMCLASFQATWDLRRPLPRNNAFQNITNQEDSFTNDYRTLTPPRFKNGKENNTPRSAGNDEKICRPGTPFLSRTPSHLSVEPIGGEFNSQGRNEEGPSVAKRRMGFKSFAFLVCLVSVTFVLPKVMLEVYPPVLSDEKVVEIVEGSRMRMLLGDRFDLIQRRLLLSLPGQAVSNCTGSHAAWSLKDSGNFIHSECKFFSSPAESVTVWGYPVKTAGILGRISRDRSLTVISGRVLEWREGSTEYELHKEGGSWILPQWAASTVHLEGSTWVVEYKGGIFSGLGSFSGVTHFLRHQVRKFVLNCQGALDATTLLYSRVTCRTDTEISPT